MNPKLDGKLTAPGDCKKLILERLTIVSLASRRAIFRNIAKPISGVDYQLRFASYS